MKNAQTGLSSTEVFERVQAGKVNKFSKSNTKSYLQIIMDNVFTIFNLINVVLAILIASTGSLKNLLFIGIVFLNILIGTIQEIRAKKILDKITLLVSTKVKIIRDHKIESIEIEQIVIDDLMILSNGNQVAADSVVIDGFLEVNESLLTGESDSVKKFSGDFIYSGSFVTAGKATVKVTNVGTENYANQISIKAQGYKKSDSEITKSLNQILKFVSIIIIPTGFILFMKSYFVNHTSFQVSILKTTAVLIGMIPEGLILLTSVSLAVGAIKLAKKNTLIQELTSLESLARVDVLCLDKTGTLTTGEMEVEECIVIDKTSLIEEILGNLTYFLSDDNFTFLAVKKKFQSRKTFNFIKEIPFSAQRKYSGVVFKEGTYFMGAYEFMFEKKRPGNNKIDK